MKLSDYVMQVVAAEGVKPVFMLPGGGAMHLNDSLGRCDGGWDLMCTPFPAPLLPTDRFGRLASGRERKERVAS